MLEILKQLKIGFTYAGVTIILLTLIEFITLKILYTYRRSYIMNSDMELHERIERLAHLDKKEYEMKYRQPIFILVATMFLLI